MSRFKDFVIKNAKHEAPPQKHGQNGHVCSEDYVMGMSLKYFGSF
jgi:hypothetical protein